MSFEKWLRSFVPPILDPPCRQVSFRLRFSVIVTPSVQQGQKPRRPPRSLPSISLFARFCSFLAESKVRPSTALFCALSASVNSPSAFSALPFNLCFNFLFVHSSPFRSFGLPWAEKTGCIWAVKKQEQKWLQ